MFAFFGLISHFVKTHPFENSTQEMPVCIHCILPIEVKTDLEMSKNRGNVK